MMSPPFENVLVLAGPTGSGKTALGIELAQRLDVEIISMDSMALYRCMDIGTAKPTPDQRAVVPHHLVDVLEPWESASVAWWLEQAKRCVRDTEARGKQVLFVGGTPLYLKALICGLFDGPSADEAIRHRLTQEAKACGVDALHQRLLAVDSMSGARIHPNDLRRIVRALEVYELTGKPLSAWQTQWDAGAEAFGARGDSGAPTIVWLDLPRAQLYERINRRVEQMFASGLIEEARQLRAMERPLSLEAGKALGYKDIFDLLDGSITQAEAISRVQMRSRNFARRQISWFRHLPHCRPVTMELTTSLWMPKMER